MLRSASTRPAFVRSWPSKLALLAIAFALPQLGAQDGAGAVTPTFEVVSVKHSGQLTEGRHVQPDHYDPKTGRFSCDESLLLIVREAFQTKKDELVAPDWMIRETYEIRAIAAKGTPRNTYRLMLQSMLAERLGLKFHKEDREVGVFALLESGKPKLTSDKAPAPTATNVRRASIGIFKESASMDDLARFLTGGMSRSVVNLTGDSSYYAFNVDCRPEPGSAGSGTDSSGEGETRDAAYQRCVRQLGLKLEPRKARVKVMIIDQANREPTPN